MAAKKTASPRVRLQKPQPLRYLAEHTSRMKGLADGCTSVWAVQKRLMGAAAMWNRLREEGARLTSSSDDYLNYTLPGHFSDEPGGPCRTCAEDDGV